MKRLAVAGLLAVFVAITEAQGPAGYKGPWDPATEAAAERAVARLGDKTWVDIHPTVLSIPALAAPVAGAAAADSHP
jgi:hypothetical protein